MAIVIPAHFPLRQGAGSTDISYGQPILDGGVTELLIDAPTWSYASGMRSHWSWSAAQLKAVVGSEIALTAVMSAYLFLHANRTSIDVRIWAKNADLTITAKISGVLQDTLLLSVGAEGEVSGTLTPGASGFIFVEIKALGVGGPQAEIKSFNIGGESVVLADLP